MTAEIIDSKSLDTGSKLAPTPNLNSEIQTTWGAQAAPASDKAPAPPPVLEKSKDPKAEYASVITKAPTPDGDKDVIFIPIIRMGTDDEAGSAGQGTDSGSGGAAGSGGASGGPDSVSDGTVSNPTPGGAAGQGASGGHVGGSGVGGEGISDGSSAGNHKGSGDATVGPPPGTIGGDGPANKNSGIIPGADIPPAANGGVIPVAGARIPEGAGIGSGSPPEGTDLTVLPAAGNVDPGMTLPLDISARGSLDIPQSMIKNSTADWTVAIELGATLPGPADQPLGAGVENQLSQLLALAKETQGKSVNFVVHAQRLVDADKEPIYNGSNLATVTAAEASNALQAHSTETERYFIHDGKIDELPTVTYANSSSDIVGLLNDANMAAPSYKLGLVLQSHGGGVGGIETNLGSLSLSDTKDAIYTGISTIGRQKLDLLDFDGCDMAEAKVMATSKDIADDVVASSAYEIANSKNDGQNLQAAMRAVLADPTMTGGQFGDKIVQQAAAGVDGVGPDAAVQTLSNFNLSNYDTFDSNLGNFGKALSAAASDPDNMKVLKADIDSTTIPATGYSEMNSDERDLKTFAQNVLTDAEAGHFKGDVKPLEDSARALLTGLDGMVTSTYGDKGHNYDKLGGLTIALPGSEATDSKTVARELSPVHKLDRYVASYIAEGPQLDYQETTTNNFDSMLIKLPKELKQQFPDEIKQMQTADDAVRNAPDVTSYRAALAHLHDVTTAVDNGPMGTAAMETPFVTGMAKIDQKANLAKPLESLAPDWTSFVSLERLQTR